jgi:hypothetical protein
MNKIFLFFAFLIVSLCVSIYPQTIPNGGFESWTGGNPDGWKATNAPPSYTTILKSSDAHSGSSSVEGDVVAFSVFTVSPSIISGSNGNGVPLGSRPGALQGYYKFISVQSDFLEVQANLKKNGTYMGVGAAFLDPASSWTYFNIPLGYLTSEVPDSALIAIFAGNASGFGHVGSKMFVDDLSWGSATSVDNNSLAAPVQFDVKQNYPNPFNPSTSIMYSVPSRNQVSIKVYDVAGNEVATVVNEVKEQGTYISEFNASGLPSGVYFYRTIAGSYFDVKKMIIMK